MTVGIRRMLRRARRAAENEVSILARRGGVYAGALASEGYSGGYRDALDDVRLALDGIVPARWGQWQERTAAEAKP